MSGRSRKRGGGAGGRGRGRQRKNVSPSNEKKQGSNNNPKKAQAKQQQQQQQPNQPEASYLLTCDIPTKQFITHLNDLSHKKFILQDLDAKHLLVKLSAREEIERKLDEWLDSNVYSAVEKVGEDFDVS